MVRTPDHRAAREAVALGPCSTARPCDRKPTSLLGLLRGAERATLVGPRQLVERPWLGHAIAGHLRAPGGIPSARAHGARSRYRGADIRHGPATSLSPGRPYKTLWMRASGPIAVCSGQRAAA